MQFQACAYCDHPNPLGTNYCNDCGATLRLKPCQVCSALAGAAAPACPACSSPFADRPIIDVDIAWAPPTDAGSRLRRPLSPALAMSEARRLATVTRALAETREVIEKASVGACSVAALSPAGQDEGAPRAVSHAVRMARPAVGPIAVEPVAAAAPEASSAVRNRAARRSEPGEDAFARFGPMVFITLLGLIAAVALLHLLRFAGESTFAGGSEIAQPYKTLLRSSPQVLEATAVAAPADAPGMRSRLYELPAAATLLEQPRPVTDEAMAAPVPASIPSTQGSDQCRPELRALNLCGKVN